MSRVLPRTACRQCVKHSFELTCQVYCRVAGSGHQSAQQSASQPFIQAKCCMRVHGGALACCNKLQCAQGPPGGRKRVLARKGP